MTHAKATQWLIAALAALACRAAVHASEDWPMYRGDAARSAYTTNRVPARLQLVWRRPARHRPSPAWSTQPRLAYDHTYHPVLFDGLLFFGSSTDHKAYALHVNKASGGTKAAVLGGLVVCGENYPLGRERRTRLCTPDDGRNVAAQVTAANAGHPKMVVTGTSSGLAGFAKKTVEKERRERDGRVSKYLSLSREPIWTCKTPFEVRDLVATESLLVVGGDGEIAVLEIDTQKVLSRAKVEGKVQSLAVAKALAGKRGTVVEAELDKLKNPRGRIVALASRTGKVKWRSDESVGLGNMLSVSTANNVLVTGGDARCAVFAADTGKTLWKGGARGRPMIHGKELRFGSRVADLLTGETIRTIPGVRGSYCTPILGSPNLIAFRVGVVGYVDLTGERGTEYFGGIRPGCYVDMTPAGGLLVMSDGASGCTCSYLNQCTIALQPRRSRH